MRDILSEDNYALKEIQDYKNVLDYFVFLNDSKMEIIDINNINELIDNNIIHKGYVPNKNSGEINVGIVETASEWKI